MVGVEGFSFGQGLLAPLALPAHTFSRELVIFSTSSPSASAGVSLVYENRIILPLPLNFLRENSHRWPYLVIMTTLTTMIRLIFVIVIFWPKYY